jgi:ribosomal protein L20A (L18A)
MAENEVTTVASTSVKKLKEYEVQRSMKWVNFTTTVQATSEEEAIEVAAKLGVGRLP